MKKLIKKWLGITRLEKENKHLKNLLKSKTNVGIDISPHQKGMSWAIVHIKGKTDYLKFYGGKHYEIREILNFLKQYQSENCLIDAPIALKDLITEELRCY